MSTRFAGSRSSDDRRRRRLAVENEEVSEQKSGGSKSDRSTLDRSSNHSTMRGPKSGGWNIAESADLEAGVVSDFSRGDSIRLPLSRLISPRLWKHAIFVLCGLLVGTGILLGCINAEAVHQWGGPVVAGWFDLSTGPLVPMFCGTTLFLAGQLSLLIWWARSRSRHDFSGRFRIWAWVGAIAIFAAFVTVTQLHHVWAAAISWKWPLDFWQHHTLLWLAPTAGCLSALFWQIKAEMRDCRLSHFCLLLTIVAWTTSAVLMVGPGPIAEWSLLRQTVSAAATAMAGHLLLMVSLLLHARHVIYITPEPPKKQAPSRLWAAVRYCLQSCLLCGPRWFKRWRQKKLAAKIDASKKQSSSVEKPVVEKKSTEKKVVEKQAAKKQTAKKPVDDVKTESVQHRLDTAETAVPEPALNLKGLSKRERRKLQKERREKERVAQ